MKIRISRRVLSAAVITTGALLAGSDTALGQANDLCANASPITDGSTAFSTVGANTDGPAHAECQFDGQTYSDIWNEYQATCTGQLTVSTCDQADYDTDLVVYNDCDCGNLILLGCNDDAGGCGGFTSVVTVSVFQDNCYLVRVGGWNSGDEGSGTVTLTCQEQGDVIGACCQGDDCAIMTQQQCADADGDGFFAGVTQCTPNPCVVEGACCLGDEECVLMTQTECTEAGGEEFHAGATQCSPNPCALGAGPDVVYTNITSISHYGPIGGIHAYSLDSHTCNLGTENLLWGFSHSGTPVLAMNAYRLLDGRLEQTRVVLCRRLFCCHCGLTVWNQCFILDPPAYSISSKIFVTPCHK